MNINTIPPGVSQVRGYGRTDAQCSREVKRSAIVLNAGRRRTDQALDELVAELERLQKLVQKDKDKGRAFMNFLDSTTTLTKGAMAAVALGLGLIVASTVTMAVVSIIPMVLAPLLVIGAVAALGTTLAAASMVAAGSVILFILFHSVKSVMTLGLLGLFGFQGYRMFTRWKDPESKDPLDYVKDFSDLKNFDSKLRGQFRTKDPQFWSVKDVADELRIQGLGEYADRFVSEGIDGSILLDLSDRDIKNEFPDMPIAARKRLGRMIDELQD